jgi:exosortase D (VPLPA-CTERM-specific)
MRLYGMSVHREGNVIDLAFTKLPAVEACSGLRSLMSLMVLALLMAYFFRDRFWKRGLLVFSAIPISIGANAIRLAVTGILHASYGSQVAEGFFHGFSGWVVFCFAFVILVAETWILKRIHPAHEPSADRHDRTKKTPTQAHPRAASGRLHPVCIVVCLILVATIGTSEGVDFREKIPINKPLETFPLKIGPWKGSRQKMATYFVKNLDLSDYALIEYEDPSGKTINLYVAYYESQRKGESIHSPATCLPGSGWIFSDAGTTNLSVPGHYGGSMQVNRAFMTKMGGKQLSYYWFPQRGRVLTNAYQLKLFTFWDALTQQRTDGALVRLITPVSEDEAVRNADQRLQEFVRLVVPVLREYIPGGNPNM